MVRKARGTPPPLTSKHAPTTASSPASSTASSALSDASRDDSQSKVQQPAIQKRSIDALGTSPATVDEPTSMTGKKRKMVGDSTIVVESDVSSLLPAISSIETKLSNDTSKDPDFSIGTGLTAHNKSPVPSTATVPVSQTDISLSVHDAEKEEQGKEKDSSAATAHVIEHDGQPALPNHIASPRDVLRALPVIKGVLTESWWSDSAHPIKTCSFRGAFSDTAVVNRLEAIAVHAGTDRITNPAVHDHRKITVLPSKYLSKTGTATPAVFMLLGIARASSIHTAENEVAQRLGMLPLDLTWYRSAGLFSHALGCNELYYPTWADDVRFSTMGKIQASYSPSSGQPSPARGATAQGGNKKKFVPAKGANDQVAVYDGTKPFNMGSYRKTLEDIEEVPYGSAVLVTFTIRPYPRGAQQHASLNVQDIIVLARAEAETDDTAREEEAWMGVSVPGDDELSDVDGGCDVSL